MPDTATHPIASASRRRFVRVRGPFDNRRLGLLTVPVTIYDLSVGGCLVHAFHDERAGRRMTLEIEVPTEGCIQVEAQSLYVREGYAFAVHFVEMADATRARLEQAINRLH